MIEEFVGPENSNMNAVQPPGQYGQLWEKEHTKLRVYPCMELP